MCALSTIKGAVAAAGFSRSSPAPITVKMLTTKITVGNMNTRAESAMPRRFSAVMPPSIASAIQTV